MQSDALRTDHVALQVFDAAAVYRFYREVLQLPLLDALSGEGWDGHPWLMMLFALADGRQLALCALAGARQPDARPSVTDLPHLAFSVGSEAELRSWQRRLSAAQVTFREEDHGTQRSIYFEDPDGLTLEITTPASPAATGDNPAAHRNVERWLREVAR